MAGPLKAAHHELVDGLTSDKRLKNVNVSYLLAERVDTLSFELLVGSRGFCRALMLVTDAYSDDRFVAVYTEVIFVYILDYY